MLWIRICFKEDPDPAFYLNADPESQPMRIHFLKGRKPVLFVNFGQFPCSWIWIRIPNTQDSQINADPCGSGSGSGTTLLFTNNIKVCCTPSFFRLPGLLKCCSNVHGRETGYGCQVRRRKESRQTAVNLRKNLMQGRSRPKKKTLILGLGWIRFFPRPNITPAVRVLLDDNIRTQEARIT
jgi:hypothetical protein